MKKYPYTEAKKLIREICADALEGAYDNRDAFMNRLQEHEHLAVQGYNRFGKIFYWNDASTRLYGYNESSAINRDLIELLLPPEVHCLARDMIESGSRTGKMPEAGSYDLLRYDGEYITVYTGHLVFQWEDSSVPEFYCIHLAIHPEEDGF